MAKLIRESRPILDKLLNFGLISGILILIAGVFLVILGDSGTIDIDILGMKIRSSSIGISAIFIGAVVIISSFKRTTKALKYVSFTESLPSPYWPDTREINTFKLYLSELNRGRLKQLRQILLSKKKFSFDTLIDTNNEEELYSIEEFISDGIILNRGDEKYQVYPDVKKFVKNNSVIRKRIGL